MKTPICDFVRAYAAAAPLRCHMPGHKGAGAPDSGAALIEALDITEVPGADVLYAPCGIIAESEANAAALFGSARTVYSVEGSSLCIRAMLSLALLRARAEGRRPLILAGRNAHRSFLSAAALLDAELEWLALPAEGGVLSCPVTAEELERRLAALPEPPAAVYLTSPDYLGCCLDLKSLAAVCHSHGALLLTDNAHGAYLKFLSPSRHPLDLGADLCCDSAHKTLPVLTGGAYLHIGKNAPPLLSEAADRAMALFAGTSPSYLILQSLDRANRLLSEGFPEELRAAAREAAALRETLTAEGWMTVGDEPLKLTLCPKPRGWTGTGAAAFLAARGIMAEFADPDFLVLMLSPRLPADACERLLRALRAMPCREPLTERPPLTHSGRRVLSPRQAMLAPCETLPTACAAGRVLASPCVSCPPAVPLLVCGEEIDAAAAEAFLYYDIQSVEVVRGMDC